MSQQHNIGPDEDAAGDGLYAPSVAAHDRRQEHLFGISGGRRPVLGVESGPLEELTVDAGILAAAARDRARFAQLFQLVAPKVKAYLIHRGIAPSAAEDLAAEAMIEVWRRAGAFDPSEHSAYGWIFQRLRDVANRDGVALPMAPS